MITGKLLSTIDGGSSWFTAPEWVVHDGRDKRSADMAARGEWTDLIAAAPPTYRQWREPGDAWLGYTHPVIAANPEPEDNIPVASQFLAGTQQERYDAQRADLAQRIQLQVIDASVRETVDDSAIEADIARYSSAATERTKELQDTADVDLDAFDPTISVAPPQNGVEYARLTVSIIYLDPWANAPDDNLGIEAKLELRGAYEDQGADARLQEFTPKNGGLGGAGSVQPFTQDSTDPFIWRYQTVDGWKWADIAAQAAVTLLWGAGSLPVTPRLTLDGLHDRKGVMARYGVPAPAGR